MSNYEVEFVKSSKKEFSKLSPPLRLRIAKGIYALQKDPRAGGNVRPMIGTTSWRLRIGDYRVIYDIFDKKLLILVIRIRHRREVYSKK